MRLGLVVYDGLGRTSGGYRYDRRIVAGLRDRGHEVTVVPIPRDGYGTNLLDNLSPEVAADLTALDVDVLLQDELCHPSLVRHNRRRDDDVPVVSIVHHLRCRESRSTWRNALVRAIERRYLETVDAFVYNSDPTRETVEGLVDPKPSVVAPPGGDHVDPGVTRERIRSRAREPGPLRVVFVGTLVERKGLHTLLRGLAALPADEWSLTVVGDPTVDREYVRRIDRLVSALSVERSVTFAGRLSDDALSSTLREGHLLAVPSNYEGFGIVYLEGMGFGLPALASAAGGAREVVTDGKTGRLVPPGEPRTVAEAVGSFATDRERLAEMGVAARDAYDAHPTWADAVDRVETFATGMRKIAGPFP
ncbi:glycosyltransferase family 4 protein [Natrinema sp. 1APR25-10V2]|uniref:glycosyltransferase family 4 protein n=1 Tax=Natrinema sp. 1APR25-10V2 TaxID=2951081 RepID=UPI0028740E25|nr:glycosyltransferase family 4 protein [Natrinema sp. 1APR25-10V2]MDS0476344.1 glycosyltransferase family 4 protein [Natrinema sp. 1APR25-10V2]